jgi:hypothetical protein
LGVDNFLLSVVTGVRLVLKNRVLYWQLQTGKPRTLGIIDTVSLQWQPLPSVSMQENPTLFHRINSTQSFVMRNAVVLTSYVVTGIQFFVRSMKDSTAYDINLFGRRIDLMAGKLENQTTKFMPFKQFVKIPFNLKTDVIVFLHSFLLPFQAIRSLSDKRPSPIGQ